MAPHGVRCSAVDNNQWYVRAKGYKTECLPARPIGGSPPLPDGAPLPPGGLPRVSCASVRPATAITILVLLGLIVAAGLALMWSLRGA